MFHDGKLLHPGGSYADENTIGREIERQGAIRPDQAAIVFAGSAPLTYRDLQGLIDKVRADLHMAGFSRTARIAIALPNGPHAALAIIAVSCSAVAVPVNPKHTLDEIKACLAFLRPDAVLLLQGGDFAARRVAEREGYPIIEGIPARDTLGLELAVPNVGPVARTDEPDADATAFILQTSGTSSEPKSIPFSHRNMLAAAARLQAWFALTPQDRCVNVSPVYYSHGLKVTIFTPLLTGGSIAFPANPSKFDALQWFDSLKPTWYSAGPTMHRLIFDQMKTRADAKTVHSLRFVLSGGAPLPRDVHEGLQEALGVPVVEHYGSSEAAQIAANLPTPGRSKLGTCGIPWPDTVLIADENGQKVPPGDHGEILVRGPTVTAGYLDAPELNRKSFVDGWFKTGDIGSLDDDGFLTLHGRRDDLINRGGEKIRPVDVDEALMRHPAVAEAAAFSVPHERLGEDVAAAVVLRPGMTASPGELRSYLNGQLAAFKIPRQITIVDQLPKGLTGKVLRRRLSEASKAKTADAIAALAGSNSDDLPAQMKAIWERLLNRAPIGLDDDFFEKGGDSLLAVEMIAEIEQVTGRTVPSSVLFEATTIRSLTQKLSESGDLQPEPLVQMSLNGGQKPLIYFHGDPGGGSYVRQFASLLGPDQPIFVVTPHGVDNTPIPRSLEAMAAENLTTITNVQPHGPYRLCGYCIGGLVAFEVARMLVAAGEKVEMVAMIDPPTANARPAVQRFFSTLHRVLPSGHFADNAAALLWYYMTKIERFSNFPFSHKCARAIGKARRLLFGGKRQANVARRSVPSQPDESSPAWTPFTRFYFGHFFWKYSIAMSRYFPKPLAIRVVFFSAEYNGKAWRRISQDLEIIDLPGDHYAVIADLANVASHLRRLLA